MPYRRVELARAAPGTSSDLETPLRKLLSTITPMSCTSNSRANANSAAYEAEPSRFEAATSDGWPTASDSASFKGVLLQDLQCSTISEQTRQCGIGAGGRAADDDKIRHAAIVSPGRVQPASVEDAPGAGRHLTSPGRPFPYEPADA